MINPSANEITGIFSQIMYDLEENSDKLSSTEYLTSILERFYALQKEAMECENITTLYSVIQIYIDVLNNRILELTVEDCPKS